LIPTLEFCKSFQGLRSQRRCVVCNVDLAGTFDLRHSTIQRRD